MKATCAKCNIVSRQLNDRYCKTCRKVVNAKRSTAGAKKERADSYYWNVTVPKLRKRLEEKYPLGRGKLGVYHPMLMVGHDNAGYRGIAYTRTSELLHDE